MNSKNSKFLIIILNKILFIAKYICLIGLMKVKIACKKNSCLVNTEILTYCWTHITYSDEATSPPKSSTVLVVDQHLSWQIAVINVIHTGSYG